MSSRILVLGANILIRAVLGNKVRDYLLKYCDNIDPVCIKQGLYFVLVNNTKEL